MLIIFDLDDTLLETTLCLSDQVLKKALEKMVLQGLNIPDFKKACLEIKRINKNAFSTKEALLNFLKRKNAVSFFPIGEKELYILPEKLQLKLNKDAKEILTKLVKKHKIALVTKGKKNFQMQKIKLAKLNVSLFCEIFITEGDKKEFYEKVVNNQGFKKEEVVVCADRPVNDLVPAKQLGYNTVHFLNGRGKLYSSEKVDFKIKSLQELINVIAKIEGKNYGNNQ